LKQKTEVEKRKPAVAPSAEVVRPSVTEAELNNGEWETQRARKERPPSSKYRGDGVDPALAEPAEIVNLSSKLHGFLIGPEGRTLNLLQSTSNTKIMIPKKIGARGIGGVVKETKGNKETKTPETAVNTIKISGGLEDIAHAKRIITLLIDKATMWPSNPYPEDAIRQLVKQGWCDESHFGWAREEFEFPGNVGVVIGDGGQTLRGIQDKTSCRITVPDRKTGSKAIIIIGPLGGVIEAKNSILSLLEEPEAVQEEGWDEAGLEEDVW